MNITREEVQQVLKSLIMSIGDVKECQENTPDIFLETAQIFKEQIKRHNDAIDLLQSKLAEKDCVEPVAYWDGGDYVSLSNGGDAKIPLFTHPTPKPMTEEEMYLALKSIDPETKRIPSGFIQFARAVERHHGIGK